MALQGGKKSNIRKNWFKVLVNIQETQLLETRRARLHSFLNPVFTPYIWLEIERWLNYKLGMTLEKYEFSTEELGECNKKEYLHQHVQLRLSPRLRMSLFFPAVAVTSGPRKQCSNISRPKSWMVGKVGGIWTEQFRLILDVLAELLKPGVPAVGGKRITLKQMVPHYQKSWWRWKQNKKSPTMTFNQPEQTGHFPLLTRQDIYQQFKAAKKNNQYVMTAWQ